LKFLEAVSALQKSTCNRFALTGTEPFLKDQFIKLVKSSVFESTTFYPDEAKEALSEVMTPNLFGETRAIILINFDKMTPDRFSSIIPGCSDTLVLSFSEKAEFKSRALTEILALFEQVSCEKMKEYGNDYSLWITNVLRKTGYAFEEDVPALIFSRVGPNMYTLMNELHKLFMVKDIDKRITVEDVKTYTSVTAQATAYDILDSLLRKDLKAVFGRISSYGMSSENIQELVKFLGKYFEKFYRMLVLREQKYEPDDIAEMVGIPRFLVKTKYLPRAQSLGKGGVAKKIDQLCTLEVGLRTFRGSPGVLFEKFILDF